MKRRVAPILTFTIALILIVGLTFAEEKKDLPKAQDQTSDATHEEEAFKTELLNATEDRENKFPGIGESSRKIVPAPGYENTKDQIIAKQIKK
jgi:hypothetical protein